MAANIALALGWLPREVGLENRFSSEAWGLCQQDASACPVAFVHAAFACNVGYLESNDPAAKVAFEDRQKRLCLAAGKIGGAARVDPALVSFLAVPSGGVRPQPDLLMLCKWIDSTSDPVLGDLARTAARLAFLADQRSVSAIREFWEGIGPAEPERLSPLGLADLVSERRIRVIARSGQPISLGFLCRDTLRRLQKAVDSPLKVNLMRRLTSLCQAGEGCEEMSYKAISELTKSLSFQRPDSASAKRRVDVTTDRQHTLERRYAEALPPPLAIPLLKKAILDKTQVNSLAARRLWLVASSVVSPQSNTEAAPRAWLKEAAAAKDYPELVAANQAMMATLLFRMSKKPADSAQAVAALETLLGQHRRSFEHHLACAYRGECSIPVVPYGPLPDLNDGPDYADFRRFYDWMISAALDLHELRVPAAGAFLREKLIPEYLARWSAIEIRNSRVLDGLRRRSDQELVTAAQDLAASQTGEPKFEARLRAFRQREKEAVKQEFARAPILPDPTAFQIPALEKKLAQFSKSTMVILMIPFQRYQRIVGWNGDPYSDSFLLMRVCAKPCVSRLEIVSGDEFTAVKNVAVAMTEDLSITSDKKKWNEKAASLMKELGRDEQWKTLRSLLIGQDGKPVAEQIAVLAEGPASLLPLHGFEYKSSSRQPRFLVEDSVVAYLPSPQQLISGTKPSVRSLRAACVHGVDYSHWQPPTPSFHQEANEAFERACHQAVRQGLIQRHYGASPEIQRSDLIGSNQDAYFLQLHGVQTGIALQGPFANFACSGAPKSTSSDMDGGDGYLKLCRRENSGKFWQKPEPAEERLSYLDLLFLSNESPRLAFLTSCQSGAGRALWGRNMNSIAEALLLGGVRFVASPLSVAWDREAATLFGYFVDASRGGASSPARWLQQAQVRLLEDVRRSKSKLDLTHADWITFFGRGYPDFE